MFRRIRGSYSFSGNFVPTYSHLSCRRIPKNIGSRLICKILLGEPRSADWATFALRPRSSTYRPESRAIHRRNGQAPEAAAGRFLRTADWFIKCPSAKGSFAQSLRYALTLSKIPYLRMDTTYCNHTTLRISACNEAQGNCNPT